MTTTSTFQGMNTDSKPSSRVLNPPGGASSNIFGGYEDNTPAQRTPIKNNPDNVNRGNNDIFHQGSHPEAVAPHIRNNPDNVNRGSSDIFNQGPHASASAPNKNSRAPRSGDDSFHSLFGNNGKNDAYSASAIVLGKETIRRNRHKSPDSFSNVFGDPASVNMRHSFRPFTDHNDSDSFSRIFGHCGDMANNPPAATAMTMPSYTSATTAYPLEISPSNHSVASSHHYQDDREDLNSSFNRVFGEYMAKPKQARARRFCDRSAYNPITGELYEQAPKNKPEPYNTGVTSHHAEGDCQVEQESVPTTDTKAQASGQATQQNQGGIFGGGASDSQDHRSTRVSQPPGGRSTKLW